MLTLHAALHSRKVATIMLLDLFENVKHSYNIAIEAFTILLLVQDKHDQDLNNNVIFFQTFVGRSRRTFVNTLLTLS